MGILLTSATVAIGKFGLFVDVTACGQVWPELFRLVIIRKLERSHPHADLPPMSSINIQAILQWLLFTRLAAIPIENIPCIADSQNPSCISSVTPIEPYRDEDVSRSSRGLSTIINLVPFGVSSLEILSSSVSLTRALGLDKCHPRRRVSRIHGYYVCRTRDSGFGHGSLPHFPCAWSGSGTASLYYTHPADAAL